MVTITREMVTLSKKEYDELVEDSMFLEALRMNGVDNWDWYDEAVKTFQEMKSERNENNT